ncbi:unnamed protein product [Schistosoma mattheei]|uniref:Uncharacterized protein n=1 Tax=Schistosoma mattheei TaxID=31246 RepID=A0A183P4A3_9TREM|nr:unnamed protein product [Schistosoma mattheei]
MEDNRKGIKGALASTCQEVLGRNKHRHREWVSMGTMDKIQERKNKKTEINNSRRRAEEVKAQAEYAEANKQVKNFKANKQKYVENCATTEEKAARKGNMKRVYSNEETTGKYSKPERPVKDKEGKLITEIQEQRNS